MPSPSVVAATSNAKNGAHALDTECLTMLLDEGVLHFRLLAKYTAAFFAISSSSDSLAS